MRNLLSFFIWSIVLCFYFLFYRRIVQVIYWSWDTFRLLQRYHCAKKGGNQSFCFKRKQDLPIFHILIASYNASDSIKPVIKAIANQDYPMDHYHAWIITEHTEELAKKEQIKILVEKTLDFNANNMKDNNLLPFLWRCISQRIISLEAWIEEIRSGNLRSYLNYPECWSMVLEDLFSLLLNIPDRKVVYSTGKLDALRLEKEEIAVIESGLKQIEIRRKQISGDFAHLLGSEKIFERRDLEFQLIRETVKKRTFKHIGKRLCQHFSTSKIRIYIPDYDAIERTVSRMIPSTQEMIQQTLAELPHTNIHHLDPTKRGHKPGALNVAYRKIKKEGLIDNPENVYFIIIDSDSLLSSYTLKTIAREVGQNDSSQAILQMASIPTANFFSEGWYSKFLSFADAIGAVGKWARSTRRQLKPDLHAGSGVVVPATLACFIEEKTGNAWDESTLTEDARLIIGQFGMMNGASNKTKMAPVFLLEAVPGEGSFWNTYNSFWNQRRRWTTGGYDEFFYMLSSPHWLRHTRFNPFSKRWEVYKPDLQTRVRSRLRQFHRLLLWMWDHFLWGIGGFIVLTHWWLISAAISAPSTTILWIGVIALLLTPLVFLLMPGRQLSWFIPGGLSAYRMCLLYFQSFAAIWIYSLPVVVTQFACIFGFRSKFVDWKPTQKPQYQLRSSAGLEK